MQLGQILNGDFRANDAAIVAPIDDNFRRRLADWRALDDQVCSGDPQTQVEEQKFASLIMDRDALALRIVVTPTTEPIEIIGKLDILESMLRIELTSDRNEASGQELLLMGAIRADLMAVRKKMAFDHFTLTEALASTRHRG